MLLNWLEQAFMAFMARLYRLGNRLTGGVPAIFVTSVRRFLQLRSPEVAASMAYYALFSLFPLLIFLVALGSFVLEEETVRKAVLVWLVNLFPTAADLIERNLNFVIARRAPAGITAIVGLLWAGSGAFTALASNINRAWPNAQPRNFLAGRLVALGMISILALLLFLSLFAGTVFSLLPFLSNSPWWQNGEIYNTAAGKLVANASAPVLTFVMFFVVYQWVPNTRVMWWEAGWGAAIATAGWQGGIAAFSWYVGSGRANYQLVYGTLGTVIALMFWIYISSLITLFGAHFSAAIAHHGRLSGHSGEGTTGEPPERGQ